MKTGLPSTYRKVASARLPHVGDPLAQAEPTMIEIAVYWSSTPGHIPAVMVQIADEAPFEVRSYVGLKPSITEEENDRVRLFAAILADYGFRGWERWLREARV